jgi:hypothetical protein
MWLWVSMPIVLRTISATIGWISSTYIRDRGTLWSFSVAASR